ncbi:MAG: hypothetical protein GF307_10305 [candidate division Zixibacteria bacterium]|nr:hypothetical protein [candidate division Zixibacteria bacterium]
MHYIIDGYNLIFKDPLLAGYMKNQPETARRNLLQRLYTFKEYHKSRITVVFDGKIGIIPTEKSPAGIKVLFTKKGTADARIIKIVENASKPSGMIVVSSDFKDIGIQVKDLGARCISSEEFLEQLCSFEDEHKGAPEKPENITPDEVDYWLKRFENRD